MYISGSGNKYTRLDMINILKERIEQERQNGNSLKIIIGGDSQPFSENGVKEYVFAIAIALHIVGNGGIFFIKKFRKKTFMHISEQLFMETSESINEARSLQESGLLDMVDSVEIHCDVGKNGGSRDYASAVKGMIESCGFNGFLKPEAAIASTLADKYSK